MSPPTAGRSSRRCGSSSTRASWCSTPAVGQRRAVRWAGIHVSSSATSVVCDPHPPYSFVAGCRAAKKEASVQDGAEDLLEIATRIGGRYMGTHRAKEFGRRYTVSGELVVRVRPTKVNSAFNIAD